MPPKNVNLLGLLLLTVIIILSLLTIVFVSLTHPNVSQSQTTPAVSTANTITPSSPSVTNTDAPSSYSLLATNSIATGHTAPVNDAAFSPNGLHLATASSDTLLKLWDVSGTKITPSACNSLYNFPFELVSLAWSADSKLIATGDINGGLKLWTLPCNPHPFSFAGLQGSVRTVAFSPDNKFLASGGADNTLRLWDITTKQLLSSYDNGRYGINSVRWSPDGTRLAFVSTQGQVTILANMGGKLSLIENRNGPGGGLRSVAWSGDGRWLAAGDQSGGITLWDSQQAALMLHFAVAGSDIAVHSLAFASNSDTLADGAGDGSVKLWKIAAGATSQPTATLIDTLNGHKSGVRAVNFTPDDKLLLSAADDHTVRLWNTVDGSNAGILAGSLSYQTTVNWTADANSIVTGGGDGVLRVWQTANAQLSTTVTATTGGVLRASSVSPNQRWLATGDDAGQLRIWPWPLTNSTTPSVITKTVGPLLAVVYAPDSQHLATTGSDGVIRLWNWNGTNLTLAATSGLSLRPTRVLTFADNGKLLVSGSDDGHLRTWDAQTLQLKRDWMAHTGYIKTAAVDQSSTLLASAGGDGSVRLWNVITGALQSGVQFQQVVESIAMAANGQSLVAATDDGALHFWQASTNQPYFTISGQGLTTLALAFAPDGKRLAATTQDGALQIWDVNFANTDATQAVLPFAPTLNTTPDPSFVTIAGGHFQLNGQRVLLKGFNFYPRLASFGSMWLHWDGPQVAADLDKAQQLGANSLRLLLPYGTGFGWTAADGTPDPTMLDELDQIINLAAQRNMRVLLTLYDFYGNFPLTQTPEEAANWRYLDALTAHYQNDPRVLGWDLHNEPDNYTLWQIGNQNQVLDWLQRVALRLRQHDIHHFVTVGFGDWHNFSFAEPDGIDALTLSDAAALHAYTPSLLNQQINDVAANSGSIPTFLEEFGWPSAPTEQTADYSEAVQSQHYQDSLAVVTGRNLDGAIAWDLWDFNPDSVLNLKPNIAQQFFGLVRLDGSLKPAAQVWQNAFAATSLALPMPQLTPTLSVRGVDPNQYPQYFAATGYAVATPFKEYWNRMGGLESFGYPISGVILQHGFLVQYFERARFEYHPENTAAPDYAGLARDEQLKRIVLLGLLSSERLAQQGRSFPSAQPVAINTFYPETNHNLGGIFKVYWDTHGSLARFGYPISEPVQEVSATDGKTYTVQYFERARFEYHPELAGTLYEVELGQLGREILRDK